MWKFIRVNGFRFYHSVSYGKAMVEDAELSMAITFTGHRLYFDERLWFIHDLKDGRVTLKNFLSQEALNGENRGILCVYNMAFKNLSMGYKLSYFNLFIQQIIILLGGYLYNLIIKMGDRPALTYYYNTIKELVLHYRNYKRLFLESAVWINRIKNSHPLTS